MKTLRRMREGLAGTTKKRAREEMTSLLRGKRKNTIKVAWHHKFVCLAFRNQERVPVTDYEKEELRQAGLGETLIVFDTLEMTQKQFKDHLIKSFPQLSDCGGFQLLKCMFMYITSEVSYLSISVDYIYTGVLPPDCDLCYDNRYSQHPETRTFVNVSTYLACFVERQSWYI